MARAGADGTSGWETAAHGISVLSLGAANAGLEPSGPPFPIPRFPLSSGDPQHVHTKLTIRRGVPADAALLAAFAARTFAETFGPQNRASDINAHLAAAYGERQQAGELSDPNCVTLMVEDEAGLAGFAQVRTHRPPPCVADEGAIELLRFYVDHPWQGKGVAQRLMAAVHQAARAMEGRTLWLSVWEQNPRAIAFYAKCGYRDVGTADFFVGPDRQTDRIMIADVTA